MKLLLLSDRESPYLWDYYQPGRLKDYDLMLSCGDLKASYLSFLVTMGRAPLLYIHGNHDGHYKKDPPEGCDCIEDKIYQCKGLRILGLGGCPLYNGGAHQYSERAMKWRIRKLGWKLKRAGGVDIVISHAAPAGYGDADDYAHRGFACFVDLIDRWQPAYWIHGHVHKEYGRDIPRELQRGNTRIINAYERYSI
ncbi:MAG: metallophosphoesterase, partial [Oscillospiraceae bacterium]|nr:metallophosphoesterase [Oscillospiraceae bacterium]